MEEDLILSKAELISGGAVRVPKGYRPPVSYSRSTAGPGAGNRSLVFSFGGMKVKKEVSDDGEFLYDPSAMTISKEGRIIAEGVSVIPAEFHCPEQAFFNIDQRCGFDCLFCTSPLLKVDATRGLTPEKMIGLIKGSKYPIRSLALTSGIPMSVGESAERMIHYVIELRRGFPNLPIGVETYVDDISQIDGLFEAGATEIKINVETATDELFRVMCPFLDRDNVFRMLAHAVDVFGRGKVSSNIIIGLGEYDDEVMNMIERLCSMGVTPTVRAIRIDGCVRKALSDHSVNGTPSPERLIRIAESQRSVMERYGLDARTFDTMCLRCTCCDLVPFIDL